MKKTKQRKQLIAKYTTILHGQEVEVKVYESFTGQDAVQREQEEKEAEQDFILDFSKLKKNKFLSKDIFDLLTDETALREFIDDSTDSEEEES